MKLSEVLLLALESGKYGSNWYQSVFMCNVIQCYLDIPGDEADTYVKSITAMMQTYYPDAHQGTALINVLTRLGICTGMLDRERFKLCKEFYIWWIIRLRGEGK